MRKGRRKNNTQTVFSAFKYLGIILNDGWMDEKQMLVNSQLLSKVVISCYHVNTTKKWVVIICYQNLLSVVIICCFHLDLIELSKTVWHDNPTLFFPFAIAMSVFDCLFGGPFFMNSYPKVFVHWNFPKTNPSIKGYEGRKYMAYQVGNDFWNTYQVQYHSFERIDLIARMDGFVFLKIMNVWICSWGRDHNSYTVCFWWGLFSKGFQTGFGEYVDRNVFQPFGSGLY